MQLRERTWVVMFLLCGACAGDAPDPRRTEAQAPAGGTTAPPPAAATGGSRESPPDLPKPNDAPIIPLPIPDGEDAGTLPLPRTAAARPPADPSITFDWQESTPLAGSCEPGRYVGMFNCVFSQDDEFSRLLGLNTPLSGPVALTLARSMNGEFLEIADGRFDAVAGLVIGASASIRGKLDCRTRRFEAMLVDGAWAWGDPALPLLPGGMLVGQILGTYQNEVISGEWNLGDPALGDCPGTWSARLMP